MRFTWDPRKASANLRKHGVTFEEATTVFADPLAMIVDDVVHTERALIIGESMLRRVLVTVIVERAAQETRIITPPGMRIAVSWGLLYFENVAGC